jgi:hypothetical protein
MGKNRETSDSEQSTCDEEETIVLENLELKCAGIKQQKGNLTFNNNTFYFKTISKESKKGAILFSFPSNDFEICFLRLSELSQWNTSIVFILKQKIVIETKNVSQFQLFKKSNYTVKKSKVEEINGEFTKFVETCNETLKDKQIQLKKRNWKFNGVFEHKNFDFFATEKIIYFEKEKEIKIINSKDVKAASFRIIGEIDQKTNFSVELQKKSKYIEIMSINAAGSMNILLRFFKENDVETKKNISYKSLKDLDFEELEIMQELKLETNEVLESIKNESPQKKQKTK